MNYLRKETVMILWTREEVPFGTTTSMPLAMVVHFEDPKTREPISFIRKDSFTHDEVWDGINEIKELVGERGSIVVGKHIEDALGVDALNRMGVRDRVWSKRDTGFMERATFDRACQEGTIGGDFEL
jgi:hypothetical protein